jgi:autotransporter-associated beta strand protein
VQSIPAGLIVGDGTHNARVISSGYQFNPNMELSINAGGTVEVNCEGGDESMHSLALDGGHLVFTPYAWEDPDTYITYTNYSQIWSWTNITSSAGSRLGGSAVLGSGLFIFQTTTNHEPGIINVTSGSLLFEAYIHGQAGLNKTGGGDLLLANGPEVGGDLIAQSGNLVFSGAAYWSPGITKSLIVSNGAQITLQAACQMYCSMHLNGYGLTGTNGALVVEHDGSYFDALVHLDSDTAIVVTNAADTIGFGGNFVSTGYSVLAGPGSLTKKGPGTLLLTANQTNGMTAPLIVDQGTLALGLTQNLAAVSSPLIIGRNPAAGTTAEVKLLNNYQIPTTVPITINDSGTLNLNGYNDTVGPLTLQGGDIKTYGGTLSLSANVLATNGVGSIISGSLHLGNAKRTFHLAPGYGVTIQAQLSDAGANAGFDLDGGGTLTLSSANTTLFGPIHVNGGVLYARSDFALGDSASGTTIANGARLAIDGRNLGAEPLVLNGDGGGYGAVSCSKTNTFTGPVTLASDAVVNVVSPNDRLTFSGAISGPGGITKLGSGTLIFTGNPTNTYGGSTIVAEGTLELSKANLAVPGALAIGDDVDAAGSHIVRILSAGQLAPTAPVTVYFSGVLDLSSAFFAPQTIAALTGSGPVKLGVSSLIVTNNSDVQYDGIFTGVGTLFKQGTGKLTLGGASVQFFGYTTVNAGTLNVQNWIPGSPVNVNSSAKLMGSGLVGNVSSAGGIVCPGCCLASKKLGTKNLSLDSASQFPVELNGTNAGVYYSQLSVTGTVSLANATLMPTLGFTSAISNKFTIIDNDAADAVTGTFKNLPEGATLVIGGAQFQITYHGGNGNDVVLTQISAVTPPQIGTMTRVPDGAIQLGGGGIPGVGYIVEANTNLHTANWISIGTATAGPIGKISFTDTNAPHFPARFYRFKMQP